ncbi:phosphotransferase [Paenibacillus sp. 1P07SE]|uniref:phosphotransferase n=1 Tax=Paenibacillus sp. 1P07SE TaxID=3132209 RepID=UPI0039A42557
MTNAYDPEGYQHGRTAGYQKGKEDGFQQGLEAARRAAAAPPPLGEISLRWREAGYADRIGAYLGTPVVLEDQSMECLKETVKSAIWKLEIKRGAQSQPLILKIFKAPVAGQDLNELNMYRHASKLLSEVMPDICLIDAHPATGDVWVFMEYVPQLKGQVVFTPDHFGKIVPSLARLHAKTYNDRFYEQWDRFAEWLPIYQSAKVAMERQKTNKDTLIYLDKAMERPELKERLQDSYAMLQKILIKGPEFFPQLLQAGQSIIHNDLQTPNMGCANVAEEQWTIKFIDWEGARFAPCWFDLFNLAGVFFAYRKDWRKDEDAVIERCSHLYANEMQGFGIVFEEDPVRLYKMAYLQRVLERSLYLQLHWGVDGQKPAFLLDTYLTKIKGWGQELGLYA